MKLIYSAAGICLLKVGVRGAPQGLEQGVQVPQEYEYEEDYYDNDQVYDENEYDRADAEYDMSLSSNSQIDDLYNIGVDELPIEIDFDGNKIETDRYEIYVDYNNYEGEEGDYIDPRNNINDNNVLYPDLVDDGDDEDENREVTVAWQEETPETTVEPLVETTEAPKPQTEAPKPQTEAPRPYRPEPPIQTNSEDVWDMPRSIQRRYYGSTYPIRKSWNQLLNLNCNSFSNTFYKIQTEMSIDIRAGPINMYNVKQVKDAYNSFMLKAYQHFNCQDEDTLDVFEKFYRESDFIFNPTGYNRENRKYYEWEDFAFSKIAETSELACQLVEMMEGNTLYEFENNWSQFIYDLESCVECQQGQEF